MATLKGNVLGNITGKIGNVSGRVRNGKNYLVSLPSSFNAPNDPKTLGRREKFRMSVYFAQTVNSNSLLKEIWSQQMADEDYSVFNLIMKINYQLLLNNMPSDNNRITPINGFNPNYNTAAYTDGTLTIETNPLAGLIVDPAVETGILATGFIYVDDPTNVDLPPYQFFNFTTASQSIVTDLGLTFTSAFPFSQNNQIANYQSIKIYSALLTIDSDNAPVQYSVTSVN